MRLALLALNTPLWSRWNTYTALICLWMHILWSGSIVLIAAGTTSIPKQLQASFDMSILRIQLRSTGVGI